MPKIAIKEVPYECKNPAAGEVITSQIRNFFIDDVPLLELLKNNSPAQFHEEKYTDSDLGYKTGEKNVEPFNIEAFIGKKEPFNQFGTGRLVLYRCQCGCDYCGVISCDLEITNSHVTWKNIGEEEDDLNIVLNEIRFDKDQYFKVFEDLQNKGSIVTNN